MYLKLKIILTISIISFFIGCGGNNSSTSQENKIINIKEEKNIQIPTDIGINIPSIFMNEDKITKEGGDRELELISSNTNDTLVNLKLVYDENQISIFLINYVLQDIIDECQDKFEQGGCELPKDTIKATFTKKFLNQLKTLDTPFYSINFNNKELLDKTFSLGKIEFNQYRSMDNFQYELIIDITKANEVLLQTKIKDTIIYTVKWSKDNSRLFFTKGIYFENKISDLIKYSYYKMTPTIRKINYFISLKDLKDSNDYVSFSNFTERRESDILYENSDLYIDVEKIAEKIVTNTYLVDVILNSKGGAYFHNQKGFISNELTDKLYAEEIFDKNGSILETVYCDIEEQKECDVYNSKLWENNINYSTLANIIYKDLSIEGGELKEGLYYFLPPNFKNKKLTFDNIMQNKIGSFIVFKGEREGRLKDRKYINQLRDLTIVYIQDSGGENPFLQEKNRPFQLLKEEDRPNLSWIDTLN